MKITKELLKEWDACKDGYGWFLSKFPQGGDVSAVGAALRADNRNDDARWLTAHVFDHFIKEPAYIGPYVESDVAATLKDAEGSPHSSSGYASKAASSGYASTAASSGEASTAASSGYASKAASSGEASTAASSGNYSKAASSGEASTAASSGNYSKAEASGVKTVAMVAGVGGRARAGEKGAFALAFEDDGQMRIAVGVVGEEGIKADTWYQVRDGKLVEA